MCGVVGVCVCAQLDVPCVRGCVRGWLYAYLWCACVRVRELVCVRGWLVVCRVCRV